MDGKPSGAACVKRREFKPGEVLLYRGMSFRLSSTATIVMESLGPGVPWIDDDKLGVVVLTKRRAG